MMASCDVYTVDELVGKRNAVLKNILREAGKPSSGTKAQLVQRILSFQIRKSATTQAAIGEKLESIRLAENQLSQLKSELTRLESSVHVHNQTGGDNFMPDPTHESSPKPDIFQATHQENPDIDYHYYYPVYPTRLYNHIGKVGVRRIWLYKGCEHYTPYSVV